MSDLRPWIWLALGTAAGALGTGGEPLAIGAWLSPLLLLRFARSQTLWRSVLGLFVGGLVILTVGWRVFPFGGAAGLAAFALAGAVVGLAPFLADRWLGGRGPGLAATLVFPLASAALELVLGRASDLGSWGATAYALVDEPGLLALVSVTGLAGPAFVVAWVASAGAAWWEHGAAARPSVGVVALTVVAVVGWGELRRPVASAETARVAAIGSARWDGLPEAHRGALSAEVPVDERLLAAVREHNRPELERLFATSELAVAGGAQLVAWSEGAATVWDVDEAAFVDRLSRFASDRDVVLVAGLVVLSTSDDRRLRNEALVVTPTGVTRTAKSIPTPGTERAMTRPGDARLKAVDTPLGRVATVVCYDLDFPALLADVAALDVDVVVAPAGDWPAIAEIHADMARFRAVEQGVSVVRPASAGVSSVIGPRGEVLASRLTDGSGDSLLFAELPTRGREPTVYGRVGDAFGGVVLVAWFGALVAAVARRVRPGERRTRS